MRRNKPVCGCGLTQNSYGLCDGSHSENKYWFNYEFNCRGEVNMTKLIVKENVLFTPYNF